MFLLVTTPFFGAEPASSPELLLKLDLFLSITCLLEILTVVDPSAVFEAIPVFGYGIGTPGGVAGVSGGVKHTSGVLQIVFPLDALLEISMLLAKTL
jgi:hypothetical protein